MYFNNINWQELHALDFKNLVIQLCREMTKKITLLA